MSVFTNPSSGSREHGRAYTAAVLDLVEGQDPLAILRGTPDALHRLIDGIGDDRLSKPEASGKWSVRQVLQHLADSELVWGFRLRMVLGQDRPTLTGYDQDAWAENLRYDIADVEESLGLFDALRPVNLRLLERVPAEAHSRVGIHSERGEESVVHMIKMYAGHDLVHTRQIERILRTSS